MGAAGAGGYTHCHALVRLLHTSPRALHNQHCVGLMVHWPYRESQTSVKRLRLYCAKYLRNQSVVLHSLQEIKCTRKLS